MPRLTNLEYLSNHSFLRQAWTVNHIDFAYLSWSNQTALHRYYLPTKHLSNEELLLTHRQAITRSDPSLPQCAGKALARFRAEIAFHGAGVALSSVSGAPVEKRASKSSTIIVRSLANPDLGAKAYAKALLEHAREQLEAHKEVQADENDPNDSKS